MCQPANIQIVSRILHIVMLIEVTRLFKAIKIFSALIRRAARPQRGVTAVTIFIRQPRRVTLIAGYWIPTLHVPTCPTLPPGAGPLVTRLGENNTNYNITTLQYITGETCRTTLGHAQSPVTRPGHDNRFSQWLEPTSSPTCTSYPGHTIISHYVL